MTIDECVDVLIKHSVCVKNMHTCNKQCGTCCMAIQDRTLLDAYDLALDALAVCKVSERYKISVEKIS